MRACVCTTTRIAMMWAAVDCLHMGTLPSCPGAAQNAYCCHQSRSAACSIQHVTFVTTHLPWCNRHSVSAVDTNRVHACCSMVSTRCCWVPPARSHFCQKLVMHVRHIYLRCVHGHAGFHFQRNISNHGMSVALQNACALAFQCTANRRTCHKKPSSLS